MRIAIPAELSAYIRLRDGHIVFKKEIPDSLQEAFQKFKKRYEEIISNNEFNSSETKMEQN